MSTEELERIRAEDYTAARPHWRQALLLAMVIAPLYVLSLLLKPFRARA